MDDLIGTLACFGDKSVVLFRLGRDTLTFAAEQVIVAIPVEFSGSLIGLEYLSRLHIDEEQRIGTHVEEIAVLLLADLEFFFGKLALGEGPDELRDAGSDFQIRFAVVRLFVSNAKNGDDAIAAENRCNQFAYQIGMPLRQALPIGKGRVVVVDDGAALSNGIGPDSSRGEIVVKALAIGFAVLRTRRGGPCLEGERFLIFEDEVVETDLATGESADLIDSLLEEFLDRVIVGVLDEGEDRIIDPGGEVGNVFGMGAGQFAGDHEEETIVGGRIDNGRDGDLPGNREAG